MDTLGEALHTTMTDTVIKQAQHEGQDMVYYDDFLGDGDTDAQGKPIVCTIIKQAQREGEDWGYYDFHHKRGCLLLRTPGPVPFGTCICSNVETIFTWVCHVFGLWISNIPRYFILLFNFWNYFVWLRITDEGSVPEMRIWSILLIKSDLKLCKHSSKSIFLYLIWDLIGQKFQTRREMSFKCKWRSFGQTIMFFPVDLNLKFDLFWEAFTITFKPNEIRISYSRSLFHGTRSFTQ